MASSKYYAYYIQGNQLALIEHDSSAGDGQTLGQPGLNDIGLSGGFAWKSPTSSVTNGIEIEYSYSPRYILPNLISSLTTSVRTLFKMNGWISVDGYLTLISSDVLWESFSKVVVDEYIVIRNSARWNGVHKVKEKQSAHGENTHGAVQTYTRVVDESLFATDSSVTYGSDNIIINVQYFTLEHFSPDANPFIWLSGADEKKNCGMFSGWEMPFTGTPPFRNIDLTGATKYGYFDQLIDEETADADLETETNALYMYNAHHEPDLTFIAGADVLSDEDDHIDLPEYLTKALVFYVKAQIAGDKFEIDQKNYLIKEFHRMLEAYENSKVWGARMIGPGPSAIR